MAVTALGIRTFGGSAFSAVAEADIQKWLTFVERILPSTVWGDDLDDATTFLTLHHVQQFVLSGGAGGAAGALSGVSVGAVSVSYATSNTSTSAASYGTTAWGQSYLSLLNGLKLTILGLA